MDEDETPRPRDYPLSPAKMSKTPSWVMLGFALGALFVVALPDKPGKPDPALRAPPALEFTKPTGVRQPQPLTTIEDVFAVWGEHASWSDDTTEVAFWNQEYQDFTDFFEVRRVGNVNYFRSIPRLTRRILTHGKPLPNSPFRFTETEEQYREWFEHGRTERPLEPTFLAPGSRSKNVPGALESLITPEARIIPTPPPPSPERIVPGAVK